MESIEWRFTDSRLPAENQEMLGAEEYRKCKNGHINFISSYLQFQKGKPKTLFCSECGTEIFRWSGFVVTRIEMR